MNAPIMLVEDNATDEKLTLRAFKKSGIANEIVVARDGAEALDRLVGSDDVRISPAIVLLDLKLPKVDGLEVLRRLRANERTSLTPVIVLTSSREDEDIIRSYQLGANAYVRKPVDFHEFVEAAKALGLFWLLLNQSARPAGRT